MASMRFHCEGSMKSTQEAPAYVRMGDMYSPVRVRLLILSGPDCFVFVVTRVYIIYSEEEKNDLYAAAVVSVQ